MTHTPNSDASEREREILIMAADDGVCSSVLSKRTANMLRADAETIRSLEAELFTRGELLTQKNEQLAARSAEVEALRKDAERFRFLLAHCDQAGTDYNIFPYDWDQCRNSKEYWTLRGPAYDERSFVDALDADMAAALQEKSRDAG